MAMKFKLSILITFGTGSTWNLSVKMPLFFCKCHGCFLHVYIQELKPLLYTEDPWPLICK